MDAAAESASALEPGARMARLAGNLDEAKAADPLYVDALALDLAVLHRRTTPELARRLVEAYPENWLAWYVAEAAFSVSPDFAAEVQNARRRQILFRSLVGN
jgi:hypothetical protein